MDDKKLLLKEVIQNLTKDDIERLAQFLMEACDVLLTYEQAAELTGKTKGALTTKINRSVIKPVKMPKMVRYNDVVKIRDKKV